MRKGKGKRKNCTNKKKYIENFGEWTDDIDRLQNVV